MASEEIKVIMKYNDFVIKKNLEEITQEDSLKRPDERVNIINWVTGHIVNSRDDLLEDVAGKRFLPKEYTEYYGRGKQIPDNESALDIETIKADYEKLTDEIHKVLAEGDAEKDQKVAFFMFHESYHAGQLGLLRKLLDKKGKIQ